MKDYMNEGWLREQLTIQKKSQTQIAREQGVGKSTINSYVKKFDIRVEKAKKLYHRKEWLYDQYITLGKDSTQIAKEQGVSQHSVFRFIKKFELSRNLRTDHLYKNKTWLRLHYLDLDKTADQIAAELGCGATSVRRYVGKYSLNKKKSKKLYENYDWLREQIIQNLFSPQEVATMCGCSRPMINKQLKKFKIVLPSERKIQRDKRIRSEITRRRTVRGDFKTVLGLSLSEYAATNGIPYTTLTEWLRKNPDVTTDIIEKFVSDHSRGITSIEQTIEQTLKLAKYDRKFHSDMRYRPDFKLTDKIALNVDGLYWHSEHQKENRYHFDMRKAYEDLGLRIFQFRGDEIRDRFPIVQSMVNNAFGKSERIYARKCVIEKINHKAGKEFLNNNHLMGSISARHVGLYYEGAVVLIVSYKQIKETMKIERMCPKAGFSVIGGYSRLLKWLERNFDFSEIHSWVDLRYGDGHSLKTLGFAHMRDTQGWKWTDGLTTFNRLRCRANMDQRFLTEREHAEELCWYKIYDAGQRLYARKI